MKIALFTNTYKPHVGGVANSVHSLACWMRKKGHVCWVFAPEYGDGDESIEGLVSVPAIKNFNGTGFSFRLPSFGKIHRNIEALQPDVIHSHHPYLMGDAAIRAASYRHVPLVFTHHTRYEDYVHYLFEDSDALERLAMELATEYANLCKQVIVPSESIRKLVTARGVKVPVTVIPTGIDLKKFSNGDGYRCRKIFGIPEQAYVLGHVGRLEAEKNLEFLARAAGRYLQKNKAAHFLMAGEGSRKETIRGILEKAGVGKQVSFLGRLDSTGLADAYKAMDVFVFSSKSETQGLVLAEAMASGAPVIAVDAPGVHEVVRDGENGYLLPEAATAMDFAEAIHKWQGQAERRRSVWKKAVRETASLYSLDLCMGKMEDAYKAVLDRHPSSKDTSPWDQLMGRFEAEWELATEKTRAATAAISKK